MRNVVSVQVQPSPPRLIEPELTVITLMHPKRPTMQRRNVDSVEALGPTVEHMRVYMAVSDALTLAHEVMADAELVEHISGRYVYVLDDDDELIEPRLSELLRRQAHADQYPAWYMVKAELGEPYNGVWPVWSPGFSVVFAENAKNVWSPGPNPGRVSSLNMIVRADVWARHQAAIATRPGDYNLALALHEHEGSPRWWDIVAARTQRAHSQGAPE